MSERRTDDDLLRALGALAREDDAERPPAGREEVFAPLDDHELDAIAERVLGASPPRRLRWRRTAMWATPLALAAAVALVLVTRPAVEDVPAYEMTLTGGGGRTVRSGDGPAAERPVFVPGNVIEVVVRPVRDGGTPPEVQPWIAGPAGVTPWLPTIERAPGGATRLTERVGDDLPRGELTLVVTVSPTPLTAAEVQARLTDPAAAGDRRYLLLSRPITIQESLP